MLAIDLGQAPEAEAGAGVTLWGQGPRNSRLPIDEVAHAAGTIAYELMCALARRVPVRVVGDVSGTT
jgi:alanine racemase